MTMTWKAFGKILTARGNNTMSYKMSRAMWTTFLLFNRSLRKILMWERNVVIILIDLDKIRVAYDGSEACVRTNGVFNIEQGIKHSQVMSL